MDDKYARSILSLHRPSDEDCGDARFREAQQQAESDPTLATWWAEEKELDQVITAKLMSTSVPAGLKERLLTSEIPKPVRGTWRRPILLAAACLVAMAVLFGSWRGPFRPAVSLADYRGEMVGFIKLTPPLQLETSNLSRITESLQKSDAPAGFEIPEKLRELHPVGCRTLRFHGHDVALICFRRENGKLAHLFVVNSAALPGLPGRDKPNYSADGEWMTAAWMAGGHAYLVMAQGDRAQLEKLVGTS